MAYEGPHPLPVMSGDTTKASFIPYSIICSGTTSTGALQSIANVGVSKQILTSNGASALPTWQNAGGPGAAQALGYFFTDNVGNVSSIIASSNVSTIVWNSSPNTYTVTFINPFSSSNYSVYGTVINSSGGFVNDFLGSENFSTSSVDLVASTMYSHYYIAFLCFG